LKKALVMTADCLSFGRWKLHFTRLLIVGLVWCLFLPISMAKKPLPGGYHGTVVIDPGHGGADTGARGSEGFQENTLALSFARMIEKELAPKYRVLLTRTGDYNLEYMARSATANQMRAGVFISIHAGGSYIHQTNGLNIYFFKELKGVTHQFSADSSVSTDGDEPLAWDTLQYRHQKASSELAHGIASSLQLGSAFKINGVEGLPLLVLRGADMPAILIEIGYLTNPLEEKKLLDKGYLSDMARSIGRAVDAYLDRP
jgi:N-acetylmuramoyl-L-alanine amidase